MSAPIITDALTRAHDAHRQHAYWTKASAALSEAIADARTADYRDYLIRGLQHAVAQVERLEREVRIEPPVVADRAYAHAYSMACAPSCYRSVV
jgi:hypothetical protein